MKVKVPNDFLCLLQALENTLSCAAQPQSATAGSCLLPSTGNVLVSEGMPVGRMWVVTDRHCSWPGDEPSSSVSHARENSASQQDCC